MAEGIVCRSISPEETGVIAEAVASILGPGDLITLGGDLGTGKTRFVQGAAVGLGVTARVTSPSFVLMREYQGKLPMLHLDVYRLATLQELVDLGIEEFMDPSSVTFVEWGDAVAPLLPAERLDVEMRIGDGDDRMLTFRLYGRVWAERWIAMAELLGRWRVEG